MAKAAAEEDGLVRDSGASSATCGRHLRIASAVVPFNLRASGHQNLELWTKVVLETACFQVHLPCTLPNRLSNRLPTTVCFTVRGCLPGLHWAACSHGPRQTANPPLCCDASLWRASARVSCRRTLVPKVSLNSILLYLARDMLHATHCLLSSLSFRCLNGAGRRTVRMQVVPTPPWFMRLSSNSSNERGREASCPIRRSSGSADGCRFTGLPRTSYREAAVTLERSCTTRL